MPTIVELISTCSDRVAPETSLRDVALRMLEAKISSVIVVDAGGVQGIITERDMLRLFRQHCSPEQTAREAMTSPVHTVRGDMDFRQAYLEAAGQGIRRVVVTDEAGLPLGIVSESDFRKHLGPGFFLQLNCADSLMESTFPRLPANARLDEALTAMEAIRGSCVVVVDGLRPLGIVTEHDIVRLFLSDEANPTLGSVMTQPTISIGEDYPLADAAQLMLDKGIRHLTVLDRQDRLVGLLTEHSLMRPLKLGLVDDALSERYSLTRSRQQVLEETARNERYQRALLDNFPFLVWLKDTESRILTTNRAYAAATGHAVTDDIVGKTDFDCWPSELAERYRADDAHVMATRQNRIVTEPIFVDGKTSWHETYKAPVIGEDGQLLGTVGFARDISEKKRTEEAMLFRNKAMAELIRGESLSSVLDLIARSVEIELGDWMCSILLCDETGKHLHVGAAPSLPAAYAAAVDGLQIEAGNGSCGTAAALQQRVVSENIFADPNWSSHLELAKIGQFSACWSDPVVGTDGRLLGTFAIYHRQPNQPRQEEIGFLTQAGQLAALVIEHHSRSNALSSSLETFRGIFDSVSEALFVQSEDGRFLDLNASAEQLFGYSRSEIIGQTQDILCVPGLIDPQAVREYIATAFGGTPQTFEVLTRNRANAIFPVEVRLHKSAYFGRPVIVASVIDISGRKYAALRLEIEHDLAQALASGKSREQVMSALLTASLRFPDLHAGALYWHNAEGGFERISQQGHSEHFLARTCAFDADSPFTKFALQGGLICNCLNPGENCMDDGIFENGLMLSEGIGCLAALSIRIGDRPVACLTLSGKHETRISPATLRSLEGLCPYFSQALQQLATLEEARRLQQNLSGLFDTLTDFIFIVDQQGRIIHYNRAVVENLGYGPETLKGQPVVTVHPKNLQKIATEIMADIVAGRRTSCPLPILRANGEQIMVETRVTNGYWDGQQALIGISQDISERLIAEQRQQLAASVFDNAHEGIMITDPRGHIVEVNTTFTELTGYSRDEAIGQTADLLKSGHHEPAFYEDMWREIREAGYWRGEVWNRKKSGEIFVEQLTISSVLNRHGEIANFVGIFSDITLIKQHQQRLEHLAHFDALTQLPNRMLLGDRLQLAMAQAERSGKMLAVCYLDLDNFKPVNDQFGHSIGDHVLIEVARRLKTCVRAGDTVSRLGGDEFVLLVSGLVDLRECDHAIGRVITALAHPFQASAHTISLSASIGVTLYPHDGSDSDALLRHADQAMYAAKQGGRNRYHLFDPENDRRARARRDELKRIREGLCNGEFVLHYQPKVNMREGLVVGAEALIRWQHPEQGLLPPGDFLPIIEGSEVAIELGDWVIRKALEQIEAWQEQGLHLAISINISGNHLQHQGFSHRLGEHLASHPGVSPNLIELEVLETAALEDIATAAKLFTECRKLGVSFALDDFGTGYSSLTYFRRLPADVLKVDQSFVRDMLDDPDDLAIVEGVIGLTQAFRRKVIAEGVESVEHGLVLLLLGCDMAQGFGIARPMPAAELPDWIRQFRPDELWSLASAFQWSREDLPMLIAEVDHKRWKKALYAYLGERNGQIESLHLGADSCRFGRWLYSPHSQRYATVHGFKTLENLHTSLHEVGSRMLVLHEAGNTDSVEALKVELEQLSGQLSDSLQQIQAEVLLNDQTSRR